MLPSHILVTSSVLYCMIQRRTACGKPAQGPAYVSVAKGHTRTYRQTRAARCGPREGPRGCSEAGSLAVGKLHEMRRLNRPSQHASACRCRIAPPAANSPGSPRRRSRQAEAPRSRRHGNRTLRLARRNAHCRCEAAYERWRSTRAQARSFAHELPHR